MAVTETILCFVTLSGPVLTVYIFPTTIYRPEESPILHPPPATDGKHSQQREQQKESVLG